MKNISKFEISVKTELLKKKLTLTALAKKLGISVAYCSDIVKGNRDAQHLRKQICEILDIKQEER